MPQYLLKNIIGTFKYIIHIITCYCMCKYTLLWTLVVHFMSYNINYSNYCIGTLCGVDF